MPDRAAPAASAQIGHSARTGSNLERVGAFNQAVVLDGIRRAGRISRIELAASTGLAPQTVTNICRRLLAEGLIEEAGKASSGPGKPRILLRLNPRGRVAVGVHLDPAVTTVVVLDLLGGILSRRQVPTPRAEDPELVIATIADQVRAVIDEAAVPASTVYGLGIGAPGPIDLERGVIVGPPNLPHWDRVTLRDSLAHTTGLPVLLDKDVVAAAVAESWHENAGHEGTTAVIYIGTGVGVGVAVDGEVLRGASGNAGEVGHVIVVADGPVCSCGARGCVAVTLAPSALVQQARAAGLALPGPPDQGVRAEEFSRIFALARTGEPAAARIVESAVAALIRLALVVTDMHDVDRLVFAGPFWAPLREAFRARVLPALRTAPAAHRIHTVELVESSLGQDMGAVGAATLVLDRFLSPRATSLTFGEHL